MLKKQSEVRCVAKVKTAVIKYIEDGLWLNSFLGQLEELSVIFSERILFAIVIRTKRTDRLL